jgi:hypothetical protein
MNLIKPRASHWYKQEDGLLLPKYEVPNKSKPGMMRKTTLADAKKGNYWPSITNVLGVLNKPALTNWLITQGILAALTLPRKPDESEDQFADRVVTDMDTEGATAREFGTRIHDALDARLQGMSIPADEDPVVTPYLKEVWAWMQENVINVIDTEYYVGNPRVCVAGRLDVKAELREWPKAILDFKTQKVRNGKAAFYDEWPLQLAAYAQCDNEPDALLISVVIDSVHPGPCYVKAWDYNQRERHWQLFQNAFELWCYSKGWDPRMQAPLI